MYKPSNDAPIWFIFKGKRLALNGPITIVRTPPKLKETIPNATQDEMKEMYDLGSGRIVKLPSKLKDKKDNELQLDQSDTGSNKGFPTADPAVGEI